MRLHQHLLNADEPVGRWDQPITPSCGDDVLSPRPIPLTDYHSIYLTNESLAKGFPGLCKECIKVPRNKPYLYLIETNVAGNEQEGMVEE